MALATNLVAYYQLDNLNDSVGSKTLTGFGSPTFTAGKLGNALTLVRASSQYATAPNTVLSFGSTAYTVSYWVKFDTVNTNNGLVGKYTNATAQGFMTRVNSNVIYFDKRPVGGGSQELSAPFTPVVGKWYHIVAVSSTTTGTALYINGGLVASNAGYTNSTGAPDLVLLGNYGDNTGVFTSTWGLDGQIDECGFFDRAMSADEVMQMFNSGRGNAYPLTDTPLLYGGKSYYKMDEASGNASDSISDITMTNQGTTPFTTGKINNGADGGTGSTARQLLHQTRCPITLAETASGFSLSLWLKPNASLTGTDDYFGGIVPSDGTNQKYVDMLYTSATNTLRVRYGNSGGNNFFDTGVNPSSGTWYHYVFTYDGTTAKTYINGSQTSSGVFSAGTAYASTNASASILGSDGGIASQPVNAVIDEWGFFNKCLTPTEVTTLYASGNGLQYPWASGATFLAPPAFFPKQAINRASTY